ncbi:MAG: hypothetical protein IH586_13900, partial [Anaerolineaceae bacterium]|nr:hypothetical protein [Anaerolineaceae bacterium]
MKKILLRLLMVLKAALHLGVSQVFWYGVYQVGLRSGFFRHKSPPGNYPVLSIAIKSPYHLPERARQSAILEI